VREATSLMLEHLEAMERELGSLVGSLRAGAESKGSPVEAGRAAPDTEPEAPRAGAPAEPQPAEPAPEPEPEALAGKGDEEKARVIALEMALSGKSREEADGYLASAFSLDDRAKLLDEIYAKVGERGR
jgi:hypothetical protein